MCVRLCLSISQVYYLIRHLTSSLPSLTIHCMIGFFIIHRDAVIVLGSLEPVAIFPMPKRARVGNAIHRNNRNPHNLQPEALEKCPISVS